MAGYLFPKYQVVNAGSPLTIAPYTTVIADPDARLWEKRVFFWGNGVIYPMMRCYFEVDEDSITTLGLPPAGKRLKINDGTKTYRVITQMDYNRGKPSLNEPTKNKSYPGCLNGNSAEYRLDLEDNLPIGRRSYWYDTGDLSMYNYKNFSLFFTQSCTSGTATVKIEMTYTKGDGSVVTTVNEYGPASDMTQSLFFRIYSKPGSNVNIKIYHKGNITGSSVLFNWLQDY